MVSSFFMPVFRLDLRLFSMKSTKNFESPNPSIVK